MKKSVIHIREVLERFKSDHTPDTRIAAIQRIWQGVVGPVIAERCRPVLEHEGTVRVGCSSSVWAQELDLMSSEVVDRLNQQIDGDWIRAIKCETSAENR